MEQRTKITINGQEFQLPGLNQMFGMLGQLQQQQMPKQPIASHKVVRNIVVCRDIEARKVIQELSKRITELEDKGSKKKVSKKVVKKVLKKSKKVKKK